MLNALFNVYMYVRIARELLSLIWQCGCRKCRRLSCRVLHGYILYVCAHTIIVLYVALYKIMQNATDDNIYYWDRYRYHMHYSYRTKYRGCWYSLPCKLYASHLLSYIFFFVRTQRYSWSSLSRESNDSILFLSDNCNGKYVLTTAACNLYSRSRVYLVWM